AHSPLVLAGGSAVRFNSGLALSTAALLINVLLGSVGKTLSAKSSLVPQTDVGAISNFIKESSQVVKGSSGEVRGFKIRSVFIYNTNPVFTLPAEFAFPYALKRIKNKVCFSLTLDETAKMCDLILPVNHWLESWQDVENMLSEISFAQPVMRPIFNTKQFEDILLEVLDRKEKKFLDYLKARWQKKTRKSGAAFEKWWRRSLERGIAKEADEKILSGGEARLNRSIVKELKQVKFSYKEATLKRGEVKRALLYPFFSLKFLDGRGANRAWLQELPDPVSQIVWDSWAEVHPDTAKEFKLKDGDQVIVRNEQGELHLHLRVTPHIVKGIVAVPAGQGHSEYGRFAKVAAGNGNLFSLLPKGEGLKFGPVKVELEDSGYRSDAVNVQGSDSQLGRGLARWEHLNDSAQVIREEGEEEEHHHLPKQMYVQREHPVYEWGMVIDLAACTGCSACVVGCFAENNVPVVGKKVCQEGREMSWIRIERYDDSTEEEVRISFLPMMCQHCNNAPCEPVCPVYATYHNEEGLNVMVYNRCVGTRYCSNNCTYKVRRFNWYEISFPHPMEMMLNPDVVKRSAGVMEKCTFCIQRIAEAKDRAKDEGRLVRDGEIQPACVQSCPTGALVFGNLKDKKSKVSRMAKSHRGYKILDHHINTQPSVTYLKDFRYKV
ncbi:MAG: 4Fe-4S dicluster domain-containing protein, partial [Candidatus Dadabacteria bacterium]